MAFIKLTLAILSSFLILQGVGAQSLPVVDLGYQIQQASSFNVSIVMAKLGPR